MKFFLYSVLLFLSQGLNSGYSKFIAQLNTTKGSLSCTTDEECQSFILESICMENLCKCPADKLMSSDASRCLKLAKEYGSPCEDDIQCSTLLSSGGICQKNECVCNRGYHYLKGSCWKSRGLHENCFREEQCFAAYEYVGLKCDKNECKCRTNYRERLKSGCRRERKTKDSCNLDSDCIDGSKCESMICAASEIQKLSKTYSSKTIGSEKREKKNLNCPPGMFELNNECVLELGMNCNNDSECNHINKATCLDGLVCACEPVTYVASENNRECLRVTRGMTEDIRKSSCKKDAQCGVFGENSFCENRRCVCKEGTYFEKENKFCWRVKPLGESCSENKDCHPSETNAECLENKSGKFCLCKRGYHAKGSECVPDATEVGKACENDEECLFSNSFCNASKVCDCKKHYYPKNGKCEPGVGSLCATNADCLHLNNTECKINDLPVRQCLCLANHTDSDDYKYCLPVADYKTECIESFQCKFRLGELGECKQNHCDCHEGAHYWDGRCYKSKFIGQPCSRLPDCYPGNDTNSVICLKGRCSCNYNYHELDEAGICVKTNSAPIAKFQSMSSLTTLIFILALRR